jgi:hypothetical protein
MRHTNANALRVLMKALNPPWRTRLSPRLTPRRPYRINKSDENRTKIGRKPVIERQPNSNLRRGGPGRPKGLPNKTTREVAEAARNLVESPEYQRSLRKRLIEGKAPHMEPILFYYAYGKPVDRVAFTDTQGEDAFSLLLLQLWQRDEALEVRPNGHGS